MRNTDPIAFINEHRDTIFRVMGVLAVLLVLFLVIRWLAMRQGGWAAATRRVRREFAVTGAAFAAPLRAWARHRRELSLLVRGLREPATWRDAERAAAAARARLAPTGGSPYAVLVGAETVTVLLAGRDVGEAEDPWWTEPGDGPDRWTARRTELPAVVAVPDQPRPVLVAIGVAGDRCAFLDVGAGPGIVTVEGDRRAEVAQHQAIAAQLHARLPEGQVLVVDGVHPTYRGQPIRDAYRAARALPHPQGIAPVLVTAELPDPLPPELVEPSDAAPGPVILLRGAGRGLRQTLLTDRQGQLVLLGGSLVVEGNALADALIRLLPDLPPVLPPAPPARDTGPRRPAHVFVELDEEEEREEGIAVLADRGAALPPEAERDDEVAHPSVAVAATEDRRHDRRDGRAARDADRAATRAADRAGADPGAGEFAGELAGAGTAVGTSSRTTPPQPDTTDHRLDRP
ncbi:hypothetical protein RM844_15380 [Streptomyces sp. DSM 44915]|uniref:Uncharacterized protein n=1 Tax=Streptomyces chisholmiae TaxID=3075540 RepID=A0ABU2JTZ4_9ACTN|nr:hypothetical protein [Streptomyces sp. DSM 44915]MDT0267668.1 hypothetical protein [Streptomyces sp. DSM 44915]